MARRTVLPVLAAITALVPAGWFYVATRTAVAHVIRLYPGSRH
jgi:hypothetical protein